MATSMICTTLVSKAPIVHATLGPPITHALWHRHHPVFHVGIPDLPERHSGAAPEVDLRPELRAGHADPVCILFGLLPLLVPWSKIVNKIGYQRTMVAGLLTMALGAFLFVPAASAASFPLFLTALIILARGNHRSSGGG